MDRKIHKVAVPATIGKSVWCVTQESPSENFTLWVRYPRRNEQGTVVSYGWETEEGWNFANHFPIHPELLAGAGQDLPSIPKPKQYSGCVRSGEVRYDEAALEAQAQAAVKAERERTERLLEKVRRYAETYNRLFDGSQRELLRILNG